MSKYLIGFVIFAVLSATLQAQDAWKEYIYMEHRMAFSMPAAPVYGAQSVDTAWGKMTLHTYALERTTDTLMVMVSFRPDPELSISPDTLLPRIRDEAVNAANVKLISEKKISIDGNPGIEFQFTNGKYRGAARIYIVGTRMYQVMCGSAAGSPIMPGTDRFLNSFRLVDSSKSSLSTTPAPATDSESQAAVVQAPPQTQARSSDVVQPSEWVTIKQTREYQAASPQEQLVFFSRWHDNAYNFYQAKSDWWKQNGDKFNKLAADEQNRLGERAAASAMNYGPDAATELFHKGILTHVMTPDEARYRIAQQTLTADPNATLPRDIKAAYEKGPPPGMVESQGLHFQ